MTKIIITKNLNQMHLFFFGKGVTEIKKKCQMAHQQWLSGWSKVEIMVSCCSRVGVEIMKRRREPLKIDESGRISK